MEKFLKNFATRRSPKSVVVYRSNLKMFFCYCVTELDNKFFIDLKKYDLMEFFDYCVTELKWHSNRFHEMHSCLSSFSTWIENYYDEQYPMFRNLLPKIEKPDRNAVREKSIFTKAELDGLLEWLIAEDKVFEQCLLTMMIASGARISEMERFKVSMIDENNLAFDDLFIETTEEMRVKGRGVDGKKIVRYLLKDVFLPYYKKWLPVREQIMKENGKEHDYVFVTKNGDPATETTFRSCFNQWNKYLNKHFYPHSMRHYWTSMLDKAGVDKELIQYMQDWSSDSMVNLYNDNTLKDKKWKCLDKLKEGLQNNSI
jgi:site-specific recombinase XerD